MTLCCYLNYGMKTPGKSAQFSFGAPLPEAAGYDRAYLIIPDELEPRISEDGTACVTYEGLTHALGDLIDVSAGFPVLRLPGRGEPLPLAQDCMPAP